MRCLLDTNIAVFMLSGTTDDISADVRNILADYSNLLFISALSIMELVHLQRNQKIRTKYYNAESAVEALASEYYVQTLQTKPEHIDVYARLRPVDGHKDQIDHFIVAQSICEKMPLISSDRKFFGYREQGLDFIYNRR